MTLAPIVLFAYNRFWHTQKTIEALQKNLLAEESDLYIFSDEAKNENAIEQVNEVREYLKKINGFKSVTIFERESNWGLANSIIDGVTKIVNEHGKIIVLEDDLVTSPYFLKFMNDALEFYKNEKKVWHVSGWNYPISIESFHDIFLWRVMNCWGWATWEDRWRNYEKDTDKVIKSFSKNDIYKFNIEGAEDFFSQVIANKNGEINTWAIFWYAIIFKQNGLCLNPYQSFVQNIGHDGSGTHCKINETLKTTLSSKNYTDFTLVLEEDKDALVKIKRFYKTQKKSIFSRGINKFSRILLNKNMLS